MLDTPQFPDWLLTPEQKRKRMRSLRDRNHRILQLHLRDNKPEVWDEDKTKFKNLLVLDGKTYKPERLFDVLACTNINAKISRDHVVVSPDERFFYCHQVLPFGEPLTLAQNKRTGTVFFTTDVVIPLLCEHEGNGHYAPWMSVTPQEVLTLRRGIHLTTGKVLVGGLGLGYFLRKVCEKKSVTEVVVVEKNRWILDTIGKRLCKLHPQIAVKVKEWICDDVYAHVGRHGDDTRHMLDIWPTYGLCDSRFDELKRKKTVKHLWGWGDVAY